MARRRVLQLVLLLAVVVAACSQTAEVAEPPVHITNDHQDWQPCEGLDGCRYIKLYGNPALESSQIFGHLKAGTPIVKHWHSGAESYVGLQGRLVLYLGTSDMDDAVVLGKGDFLRYPGGTVHWGYCDDGDDCLYYVFNDEPYDIHLVAD